MKYQKLVEEHSDAKKYLETKNYVEQTSLQQLLSFKSGLNL